MTKSAESAPRRGSRSSTSGLSPSFSTTFGHRSEGSKRLDGSSRAARTANGSVIGSPHAEHGWLAADDSAPSVLEHVVFDGTFPTRRQEYRYARDRLSEIEPGLLLDAGTGCNAIIHVFPYIAANMGWRVEALDIDIRQFALPFHDSIRRSQGSIGAMPFQDRTFDAITCISTLEHVSAEARLLFEDEAFRLLKPGGALIITADEFPPEQIASWFEERFDVGPRRPDPPEHLEPRVSFLSAIRP